MSESTTPDVHLYVLLDRSGSMAAMADDVIGGFNHLLAEQRSDGNDARMTLVQFDSIDPQHVIADAVPIAEMTELDAHTFSPRGATPLLDATGTLMGRAAARVAQRAAAGLPAEQVIMVSITDGHENSSSEFTLSAVRQLVDARTDSGWSFVFLGAAVDAYDEATALGYDTRSTQTWAMDGDGARAAFSSLSRSTAKMRAKLRAVEDLEHRDFFEGDKSAEADRRRRKGA